MGDDVVVGSASRRIVIFVVAVAVVVAGRLAILSWLETVPHYPGMDASHYTAMARGDLAFEPYAWRVLVPFLAGLLPLEAPVGLELVTYAGLVLAYSCAMWVALRLGARLAPAALAVVVAALQIGHLYNFYNPALTDGAAMGAVGAAMAFAVVGRFGGVVIASVLGVLTREPGAAALGAWLPTRRWGQLAAAAGWTVGAHLLVRLTVDTAGVFFYSPPRDSVPIIVVESFASWGFVWLAPLGLLLARRFHSDEADKVIALGLGLAAVGGVSVFVFSDTARMLQPLMPVLVVGLAVLFSHIGKSTVAVLTVLAGSNLLWYVHSEVRVLDHPDAWQAITVTVGTVLLARSAWPLLREGRLGRPDLHERRPERSAV